MGLTEKQAMTLTFIADYLAAHGGVSPSFQEIIDHLGVRSKCSAHRLVARLAERGYVRMIRGHARSLEVIRRPGEPEPNPSVQEPAPKASHLQRYQVLDDLLHRHYVLAMGEDPDSIMSKALHWIATAAARHPTDWEAASALRRLGSAIGNASIEFFG